MPTLDGQPGCGTCHTLANAGTTGTRRPEPRHDLRHRARAGLRRLDDPRRRPRPDRVPGDARPPRAAPGMPAQTSSTGQDARDVADYVAECARLPAQDAKDAGVRRAEDLSDACGWPRPSRLQALSRTKRVRRCWRARSSTARSTTTCVTGQAKRSRVASTMPRSSQFERPSGCVEMISSSGANMRMRVLDRLQRVAVADLAARLDAGVAHRGERRVEPVLRRLRGRVLVGDPVLERRVERRADDEHLRAHALDPALDRRRAAPRRRRSRSR